MLRSGVFRNVEPVRCSMDRDAAWSALHARRVTRAGVILHTPGNLFGRAFASARDRSRLRRSLAPPVAARLPA
ncbi:hypothetical protein BURK1_03663 [Burkholderiales bacterium]|nr:hypothetical protein BURK1_03663 [Burkholderiales bacterium]